MAPSLAMGMPICKNSRAAISRVTHCRVILDVLSLFRIDRKGRCFDRLEIVGSTGATAGLLIDDCDGAAAAVPNVTALFDLGIFGKSLNLEIGDKEESFRKASEGVSPPNTAAVFR